MAAFTKAPPTPFESENNTGQQSGLPEEKSRRETEARQLRSAATKGSRHECPRRPGAPGPSFLKSNKFLYKIPHAHTCACSEVGGRGDSRPGVGSEVATPRIAGRRWDAISRTRRVWEPRLAAGRGAGRGRAPTRTFHARRQLPAQSGLCLGFLSRRPGSAAAWAVARPRRAKDAPRLFARPPAEPPPPLAKGWRQDRGAGRASLEARAATSAEEAGAEGQSLWEGRLR